MHAFSDFITTDYGLMSAAVILFMLGMGGFYVRYFLKHMHEDEAAQALDRVAGRLEQLAAALFAAGQATQVIAAELPRSHAFMHLDTVMTMLDRDTFVAYPYLDTSLRTWTITPADE